MSDFRKPFVKSAQELRGTSEGEQLVLQKADLCDTTRGQSRLLLPYRRHTGAEGQRRGDGVEGRTVAVFSVSSILNGSGLHS